MKVTWLPSPPTFRNSVSIIPSNLSSRYLAVKASSTDTFSSPSSKETPIEPAIQVSKLGRGMAISILPRTACHNLAACWLVPEAINPSFHGAFFAQRDPRFQNFFFQEVELSVSARPIAPILGKRFKAPVPLIFRYPFVDKRNRFIANAGARGLWVSRHYPLLPLCQLSRYALRLHRLCVGFCAVWPHGIHLEGQRDGSHYRRLSQPHDLILGPISECSSLLPLRGPNFVHLSFGTLQGGSSGILTSI